MSVWRRKALEAFPDLAPEINEDNTTIYMLFFEILPRCIEAHKDFGELQKIYNYAEWCFRQKSGELCNAVAVSFYEHLGDYPESREDMYKWVKRDIFVNIGQLLEARMEKSEYQKLRRSFD